MRGISATNLAETVAEILNDEGYKCNGNITSSGKRSPIYAVGGCGCGSASDFQMYYRKDTLAIVPPILGRRNQAVLLQRANRIRRRIMKRYPGLKTVDIVDIDGKEWPEYLERFRRRRCL